MAPVVPRASPSLRWAGLVQSQMPEEELLVRMGELLGRRPPVPGLVQLYLRCRQPPGRPLES